MEYTKVKIGLSKEINMPEENKVDPPVDPAPVPAANPPVVPAKEEVPPVADPRFGKMTERMEALESKNEELSGRNEVLQDSLDSALEEMVLRAKDPLENTPVDPAPAPAPAPAPPVDPPKEGEPAPAAELEKEIEKSIKEDSEARGEIQTKVEGLLTREAIRDLQVEIGQSMTEFPKASEKDILQLIEDGSEKTVNELAKVSHETRVAQLAKLKDENIEEYKAQIKKEEEGGISIPQSPGSPGAPKVTAPPGTPQPPTPAPGGDEEWGNALDKAKVEVTGV